MTNEQTSQLSLQSSMYASSEYEMEKVLLPGFQQSGAVCLMRASDLGQNTFLLLG